MISDKQQAIRRNGFAPVILIVVLALVIAVGGIGIGLAWRTNYLDKYLPARVKDLLGKETKPGDQGEEPGEELSKPEEEDETKDWKTYTDIKYGFSVKYPKNWTAKAVTGEEIRVGDPFNPALGSVQLVGPKTQLSKDIPSISALHADSEGKDATSFIEDLVWRYGFVEGTFSVEKSIKLGGLNGIMFSFITPGMDYAYKEYYAVVVKDYTAFYVTTAIGVDDSFHPLSGAERALLDVFEGVISSFKFLD